MTWDPVGWGRPSGRGAGGPGGPGGGVPSAAAALERAADAVATAVRGLVAADDVAWSTPAAARYRAALADAADGVRRSRAQLDDAHAVAARHDVEVTLARDAQLRSIEAQALAWLLGATG